MSEGDVQGLAISLSGLKDDLVDLKGEISEVKELGRTQALAMADLRVLLAGNYCTRADLDAAKESHREDILRVQNDWLGAYKVASNRIIGIYVGIITILASLTYYAVFAHK